MSEYGHPYEKSQSWKRGTKGEFPERGQGRAVPEERKEKLGKQNSAFSLNKKWDDITQRTHMH